MSESTKNNGSGRHAAFEAALGEAMTHYSATCAQAFASLQKELTEFAQERFEHNRSLAEEMAGCKDWRQLAALQQTWLRDLGEAYMKESTRLAELSTQLSRAWLEPLGALMQSVVPTGGLMPGGQVPGAGSKPKGG